MEFNYTYINYDSNNEVEIGKIMAFIETIPNSNMDIDVSIKRFYRFKGDIKVKLFDGYIISLESK